MVECYHLAKWATLSPLFQVHVLCLCGMQVFDGSNNSFSGTLPSAWSAAVQLQHVNVSFNKLTGSLPTVWASLGNLSTLDMSNNTLQVSSGLLGPSMAT